MQVRWEKTKQRLRRSAFIAAPASVLFIFFLSIYFLSFHEVSLAVDGRNFKVVTRAATVGDLLRSEGISFSNHDRVWPAPGSPLAGVAAVRINRAYPVALTLDYETEILWTMSRDIGALLHEKGIDSDTEVLVDPSKTGALAPGMWVKVAFLKRVREVVEEQVAYGTKRVDNGGLIKGRTRVTTAGKPGIKRKTVEHVYAAGREIKTNLIKEEIVQAPQEEVIAVGTKLPQMAGVAAPASTLISRGDRSMLMVATGYAAGTGGAGFRTATGTGVYRGIVAVDPRVIPLGTRLYIDGYGEAVAADTGGAIKGNRIDLGFNNRAEALQWGRRTVTVRIL